MGIVATINQLSRKIRLITSTSDALDINTEARIERAQRLGKYFSWVSLYDSSASDFVIYLRNTSTTEKLFIDDITVTSTVNTQYKLFFVTGDGDGTPITGVDYNRAIDGTPDAVAFNKAGTLGTTNIIACNSLSGRLTEGLNARGLVLGLNEAIAIQTSMNNANFCGSITGFYE